jgi:integrase
MPRPRKNERVVCRYFVWLLSQRDGVWRADGRSNPINLGRHSLATRDRDDAQRMLDRLDLTIAVRHGLAEPDALGACGVQLLQLADGRRLYEAHAGRPGMVGGTRPSSQKRYRAVFDKFLAFAGGKGLTSWNQVTARVVEGYVSHLEAEGYAYSTRYLEATTIKQAVSFLVQQKHLPPECRICLPLRKPQGTGTYCWRPGEVRAILDHCRTSPGLRWLEWAFTALTYTGLRISELIALRWTDVDFENEMIRLVDESTSRRRGGRREVRTLKGGYGRSFPINEALMPVLRAIPPSKDGFVFHGPEGGRLKAAAVRRALIRDVLTPLAETFPTPEGEVGFADGRLHSFRHFFCSLCALRGTAQQVVMQWLGHRDSKMVQHYFHLHDNEARRQMKRITLSDDEAAGA